MPERNSRPGDYRLGSRERHDPVERAGAGANFLALDGDFGKTAAETDRDARNPALPHHEVRADTDDRHRNRRRQSRQKSGKIRRIGGPEQHFRRSADAEPGLPADRRVRDEPAPHRRKPRNQRRRGFFTPRHH